MRRAFRSTLAVVVGVVTTLLAMLVVSSLGWRAYPAPGGVVNFAAMPFGRVLGPHVANILAACLGAWIAARLAPRSKLGHGLVVAGLFFAAEIATLVVFPYPVWVWFAALPFSAAAGWGAARAGAQRSLVAE